MGWYVLDWSGSGYGPVEGSREHGDKPSGSIKRWEVFEWLHNWRLLKKGSDPWVSEWVNPFSSLTYLVLFRPQEFNCSSISMVMINFCCWKSVTLAEGWGRRCEMIDLLGHEISSDEKATASEWDMLRTTRHLLRGCLSQTI
jgi:hypothetical protein